MAVSRRTLVSAAVALPALLVAERGLALVGRAVEGAVTSVRPAASGTTATQCAQCGAPDHTMLDARCPLAPRVHA